MINDKIRLAALFRRLQFEIIDSLGLFKLINKYMDIKEPFKTMYYRKIKSDCRAGIHYTLLEKKNGKYISEKHINIEQLRPKISDLKDAIERQIKAQMK